MILGMLIGSLVFVLGFLMGYYVRDQKPTSTMDISRPVFPSFNTITKKKEKLKPRALDDETLYQIEKKEKTGQD